MQDKNIVLLEGIVGDDFKYGRTKEGKDFATFSLCINAYTKEFSDATERTHSQTYIRIFCYDKKQLEYLQRVNACRGNRASVFGRLSSFKNEYKGNTFMTNNVVCRDITIIKTKKSINGEKEENLHVITD